MTQQIVIVGDGSVGKSTIVSKFINEPIHREYSPTIGVDFHTRILNIDGERTKFSLWDMSGQPMYRSVITMFFSNAEGCVLVYDVTNRSSFENVSIWADSVKEHCHEKELKIVLVGTKTDVYNRRQVSIQEGLMCAANHQWQFTELDFSSSSHEVFANLSRAMRKPSIDIIEEAPSIQRKPCCKIM